jgi:hypothetical protein
LIALFIPKARKIGATRSFSLTPGYPSEDRERSVNEKELQMRRKTLGRNPRALECCQRGVLLESSLFGD